MTELTAERLDAQSIKLSWKSIFCDGRNADDSTEQISYKVCFSKSKEGTFSLITENLEKSETIVSSLAQGTPYYFKIKAILKMDGKEFSGNLSKGYLPLH